MAGRHQGFIYPLHSYDFFSHFVSLFSQFNEIELRNAFYWKRSRGLLRASPHVVFWTKFVHIECKPRPARFAFKMKKFCSVFDIRRCSKLIWFFFATGCVVDCLFTPGCVSKFKLKSIRLTPIAQLAGTLKLKKGFSEFVGSNPTKDFTCNSFYLEPPPNLIENCSFLIQLSRCKNHSCGEGYSKNQRNWARCENVFPWLKFKNIIPHIFD